MKLKKRSVEEVAEEAKAGAPAGGAFISARLRNPADDLASQSQGAGDTLGGICAIIATVLMAGVTFLLYFSLEAIKSSFPLQ